MNEKIAKIVDPLHLEDLTNAEHPSLYVETEDYVLLIIRIPFEKEKNVHLVSYGFVGIEDTWYFYEREKASFVLLEGGLLGLHQKLDRWVDGLLLITTAYREDVTALEEALYGETYTQTFMPSWFALKREMVRTHRVLLRTLYVYESFFDAQQLHFAEHHNRFDDLMEHLSRSSRYIEHDIEKLNNIYNFYSAQNNDKMNRSIYVLTILSAIFLPLNLIVGFFGMNTGNLPFHEGSGTWYVSSIILVITSLMLLFIWTRRGR